MLITAVEKFIVENDLEDKPLTVALSGGADSVAMLLLLNELKSKFTLNLSAVHINHGLSANASQWARFCRILCERLHVPFQMRELNIVKPNRVSLEQIAREARYQTIGELMPSNSILFTGHHSQDQFETLLLRLMRGAGLTGLGSMKSLSPYPIENDKLINLRVARPLLGYSKSDLIGYLKGQQQDWVEDESNHSDKYDRNYIRHNILPMFESRWPKAPQSVVNTTSALQVDNDLLNDYLDDDLEFCVEQGFAGHTFLNLNALESMAENKRRALLRRFCLLQTGQSLGRNAMAQIETQMFNHNLDTNPKIQLDTFWAMRFQHRLYIVASKLLDLPTPPPIVIEPNETVELNGLYQGKSLTLAVEDDAVDIDQLVVKYGCLSDKMKINIDGGSKPVKQLLKECQCPAWWRNQVPLIYEGGDLAAVGDHFVAMEFQSHIAMTITSND